GKPHEGVFAFQSPIADDETELTIRLEQLHGGGHLIGRFRLSVTDAAPPVKVSVVPTGLRAILATPADKRTPQQTREPAVHVLREQTQTELAGLPAPAQVYAAAPNFAVDGSHKPSPTPRVVHLLKRGDIRKLGDVAEPGTVSCVPGLPSFDLPANAAEG